MRTISSLLRTLPISRGKRRLARFLLARPPARENVQLTTRNGLHVVVPSLIEPISISLLATGSYEPQMLDVFREYLPVGGTFVDVGANIGLFAGEMSHQVGPMGHVIAIEASNRIFSHLLEMIALNHLENVRAILCAAHDRDEEAVSFWDAPVSSYGMGSLSKQFGASPVNVPARTLDGILAECQSPRVHVMKVDVEGFEAAVFRGASKLLAGPEKPVIAFEFNDWAEERAGFPVGEAQRILLDFGYRLRSLENWRPDTPTLSCPMIRGSDNLVATPS